MKKKYTFLREGPWQYAAGDVIRKFGSINYLKGAGVGAGVGSLGNIARNAMKSDDDPTKTGIMKAAITGAGAGAATGALVGGIGGKFARSNAMKDAQNSLMRSGDKSILDTMKMNKMRQLMSSGMAPNDAANTVQAMINRGDFNNQLRSMYNFGNFKGYDIRQAINA